MSLQVRRLSLVPCAYTCDTATLGAVGLHMRRWLRTVRVPRVLLLNARLHSLVQDAVDVLHHILGVILVHFVLELWPEVRVQGWRGQVAVQPPAIQVLLSQVALCGRPWLEWQLCGAPDALRDQTRFFLAAQEKMRFRRWHRLCGGGLLIAVQTQLPELDSGCTQREPSAKHSGH